MAYYRSCEYCGAALDPGERCDCRKAREEMRTAGLRPVKVVRWSRTRRKQEVPPCSRGGSIET